jgi:hypothetical protein
MPRLRDRLIDEIQIKLIWIRFWCHDRGTIFIVDEDEEEARSRFFVCYERIAGCRV